MEKQYLIVDAQTPLGGEIYNRGRYLITDQPGPGKRISSDHAAKLIEADRAHKEQAGD